MKPDKLKIILDKHKLWRVGDPGGARADLAGADLARADLAGADLAGADLAGADLEGADLEGADLEGAYLAGADLSGAYLSSADLEGAYLEGADLEGADLEGAYLAGADLAGANLEGAILPDGRTFEDYKLDHLAGIFQTPDVRAKAISAWGKHSWHDCPMHCALGISSASQAPDPLFVGAWVALYDGEHLSAPEMT